MQRQIFNERRRPKLTDIETRAKAKFDQQIVAIASRRGIGDLFR
jgi:hypothetical protein